VVAKAEAAKVAHDIARVTEEARQVGGRHGAAQALHAVQHAMTSASLNVSSPRPRPLLSLAFPLSRCLSCSPYSTHHTSSRANGAPGARWYVYVYIIHTHTYIHQYMHVHIRIYMYILM